MRVLVLGNSHAGCVRTAYLEQPTLAGGLDLYFYVVPGGMGPSFELADGLFTPRTSAQLPPYFSPEQTPNMRLDEFDAVVFSALGYVDGGFAYVNPITSLAALSEFGPTEEALRDEIVSDRCYETMIAGALQSHRGFKLLSKVRKAFDRRILVQPVPYPAPSLSQNEEWQLRKRYADYLGAHSFFLSAKNKLLKKLSAELPYDLLPYPDVVNAMEGPWTPEHLMRERDAVHAYPEYGKLVLQQLAYELLLSR